MLCSRVLQRMAPHLNKWFDENLSSKRMRTGLIDTMVIMYKGIEGSPPGYSKLMELMHGGKYVLLRKAAKKNCRDLKNRYFKNVRSQGRAAITTDAIRRGEVHTTESLFKVVSVNRDDPEVTFTKPYGVSNRAEDEGLEFLLPAFDQHLNFWSELTLSRNVQTGKVTRVPYAGGQLFTTFIEKYRNADGELPTLDSLSVKVAYIAAKEHGINCNHGLLLGLAALEWKQWYALPNMPRVTPAAPRRAATLLRHAALPRCHAPPSTPQLRTSASVPALLSGC